PFNLKEFSDDKLSIVDVRAKDEKGALYTIEVQLLSHSKFIERSLYYLARLYSSQIKEGEQFTKLRPTIAISIVNFDLLSAIDELHNVYKMINEKTKTELTDIFELHFVEMTKFKIDKPRSLRTRFEKWLHVLKFGDAMYGGENGLPEELLTEEGIIMAFEEMKKVNADSEMRYIMEARAQAISTIATLEDDYYNKGKIEGQLEAKLEAARNLLDVLDVKTIAEKLGLSVDEVNNLKQSQK
nr:Rpn family recombination-promoting nuclease/putative transposase [Candidatus Wallbacteria bacterium]